MAFVQILRQDFVWCSAWEERDLLSAKQIVFRLIERKDLKSSDEIIRAESRQSDKSQKSQPGQFYFFWSSEKNKI